MGFLIRLLLILPLLAVLVYSGEHYNTVDNVAIFMLILLSAFSTLYLVVMTLIPAEYAIKTDIKIIEFNMWMPQIVAVYITATAALALCFASASYAFYPTAVILFLYATSTYMWPRYITRIDIASKDHMIKKLQEQ